MNRDTEIAGEKFKKILSEQLARVKAMRKKTVPVDYRSIKKLRIGICRGDGIGPEISKHAESVLRELLAEQVNSGRVEFIPITGLTLEKRAAARKAIPDDVLAEIKSCHVLLKGPTTTPQEGDGLPNIESANVAIRRELDLFANIRPVKIPAEGIDWTFFRENTEGEYILGSKGFDVTRDLSVDFKIVTQQGCERIIRMAFEYAKRNNLKRVTVVTKANVIKTTDGRFSRTAKMIAAEYKPGVECDEWYVDIMSAKLLDTARRRDFQVVVLPNLYGDIITDEAAQLQGGVGTAGSANVGWTHAMFEAIHGSAPRMVKEGRIKYADPASMLRAAGLLLNHIGYTAIATNLEAALDVCTLYEKNHAVTGRSNGATGAEFTEYVLRTVKRKGLIELWKSYAGKK